jgi:endonuclease/exonuclease/phosphatase family metal-dependent hydrolase
MLKKILKALGSVLLLAVVAFLVVELWYLPRFLLSDARVELPEAEATDGEITIMSANVRCYAPDDLFEKSWFYRADLLIEDVNSVKPDIIGFQEVSILHYGYLQKAMPDYDSELMYRDDWILSEGCPVFYRTDKYEKLDSGSFWLSETPEVMSKDWGAAHYRVCTYVILKDKMSGREFVVFNTHLDHVSEEARINGIQVVLDKIEEFGGLPAFLMGDLNAYPDEETILFTHASFDDAHVIAEKRDDGATFHKWGTKSDGNDKRIDYIMISKGDATVSEYRIVNNKHGDAYSSDHYSIYIKVTLN